MYQRQTTAVAELNESWIFRVPSILHDSHSDSVSDNSDQSKNGDAASASSFSPRVLSLGPLQAYLDRKLYYDSHLYATLSRIKSLAHQFILVDHPESHTEFKSFLQTLPNGFHSYLQTFYSPNDLIHEYRKILQKQNELSSGATTLSSPTTSSWVTSRADLAGKFQPSQLIDLELLITRDACFLAAFLKSLLHEVWPFLKLKKLQQAPNFQKRISELLDGVFRSSKSNALYLDKRILSPHLVKAIMEDILLIQNQIPLAFVRQAVMIDAGCKTKEEARELLDLYMAALAYRMLPFYRSKVQVFACIRELNTDNAPHLLDVMHSLMVRSSSGGGEQSHAINLQNRASASASEEAAATERGLGQEEKDRNSEEAATDPYTTLDNLPGIIQMVERGVSLASRHGSVKALSFHRGRLVFPRIQVDDNTERLFKNLIAYESHSKRKKSSEHDIVSYLHFMDLLIDTPADVHKLVEKGVVSVSIDSNEQVAHMFNRLCRRSRCVFSPHYLDVATRLHHYTKSKWRRNWAEFYNSNLSRPWLIVSFLAAIALFVMTFVIMYYTILLYHNDVNESPGADVDASGSYLM